MLSTAKYIKTDRNCIIVFSAAMQHKQFKHLNPVTAGFISFTTTMVDGYAEVDCNCYGESVSLEIKSDVDNDTRLAKQQILNV
jgi:hypothetical protein